MAPFKRMRQPKVTTQALLDFDLGESSSDSDFRIEDHCSDGSKGDKGDSSDESSSCSSDTERNETEEYSSDISANQLKELLAESDEVGNVQHNGMNGNDINTQLKHIALKTEQIPKTPLKPMCCVCLGERSDDINEIIECDGCGVSVHEGCYGVSDNVSISSTNSTCSTEPWFCEACRAGVVEPSCELCPNTGGIYKETDVGKWVHLICALYVPGVAFGEVEQLSSVTLFEMQYNKWGAKVCSLCDNPLLARTGVCIGCDAGMCKTYFHVTCAQAVGFLIEAHHEDADAADPFYAHCKVHSEKEMIRKRKRNYQTLRLNMQQKAKERLALKLDDPSAAQLRIQRKLQKYQNKYSFSKQIKPAPWVPTQKMSRLLTTSASACKRLLAKAQVMSVDVELLERQEAQIAALTDIRKKWHIAPAFSVEFVAYYMDRISRMTELKEDLKLMLDTNNRLTKDQDELRRQYDNLLEQLKIIKAQKEFITSTIIKYHKIISTLCPNKQLPNPETIGRPQPVELSKPTTPPQRPISVPTAAALKMGVGFPLVHLGPPGSKVDATRMLSTHAKQSPQPTNTSSPLLLGSGQPTTPTLGVHKCGICKRCNDQYLLANCDTCNLHYHLGCLNPPLTRHPKKSKQYGWQCSECCDKSDLSDVVVDVPKRRRKSRTRYAHDGYIIGMERRENVTTKRQSMEMVVPCANESSMEPKKPMSCKKLTVEVEDIAEMPSVKKFKPTSPMKILTSTPVSVPTPESYQSVPQPIELSTVNAEPAPPSTENAGNMPVEDSNELRQSRKQKRKDKHKNKHYLSSDTEKSSPSKEHKRKRKKKQHFDELQSSSCSNAAGAIPKIRIKFKTLPLPGEEPPEAQFFYVSADAVRSAEEGSRPTSVETVDDSTPPTQQPITKSHDIVPNQHIDQIQMMSPRKTSPRKLSSRKQCTSSPRSSTAAASLDVNCCVCAQPGKVNQVVTCDECGKHYHFTCLDPPLKKTPKIRGYSWHCADCDPTDEEQK